MPAEELREGADGPLNAALQNIGDDAAFLPLALSALGGAGAARYPPTPHARSACLRAAPDHAAAVTARHAHRGAVPAVVVFYWRPRAGNTCATRGRARR